MSKIKLGAYNTLTVLKVALREGNGEPFGLFLDGDQMVRFSCLRSMCQKVPRLVMR